MNIDKFSSFVHLVYQDQCAFQEKLHKKSGQTELKFFGGSACEHETNIGNQISTNTHPIQIHCLGFNCLVREIQEELNLGIDGKNCAQMTSVYFKEDRHLIQLCRYDLDEVTFNSLQATDNRVLVKANANEILKNPEQMAPKHWIALDLLLKTNPEKPQCIHIMQYKKVN